MALNSSGPISLGGTTTGQSIALENGGSGTSTISLNDAAVRSLAGVASGAIAMPTDFWGKSNATYLLARFSNTEANWLTQDTSGNVFIGGNLNNSARMGVVRLTSAGVMTWGVGITAGTSTPQNISLANPASGTTIACTYASNNFFFGKATGNFISAYQSLSGFSSTPTYFSGFTLRSVVGAPNGYLYGTGNALYSFCCSDWVRWGVARYNTSGVCDLLYYSDTVGQVPGQCTYVDASNNVYTGGTELTGSSSYYGSWAKMNSSFGITVTGKQPSCDNALNIKTDSAGNIYVMFQRSGSTSVVLIKYNSSGTLQWQRGIGATSGSTGNFQGSGLAVDTSDNIYVSGISDSSAGSYLLGASVVKFNSSGTVQWQRRFYNTSYQNAYMGLTGQTLLINAGVYVITMRPTTGSGVVWYMPLDGTKTGSYPVTSAGTWTYSVDTIVPVTTTTLTGATTSSLSWSSMGATGSSITSTYSSTAITTPTIVSV